MENLQNSIPSQGQGLQRKCILFYQNPFHGYYFSYNHYGHKTIEYICNARKNFFMGGSYLTRLKMPRNKNVSRSSGFDQSFVKYNNPFSPLLSHDECYNCLNFRHKAPHYKYDKNKLTS